MACACVKFLSMNIMGFSVSISLLSRYLNPGEFDCSIGVSIEMKFTIKIENKGDKFGD